MDIPDRDGDTPLSRLLSRFAEGAVPRRAFLRTATALGLSASAAGRFAGIAAASAPSPARRGGTLRLQIPIWDISHPATFEWFNLSQMVSAVCDWACVLGSDGMLHGGLLESWSPSPDLRSWTFRVRPGVTWRDGRRLIAEDIVWNIRRWLDPAVGSPYIGAVASYLTRQVDGHVVPWDANWIEAPDDLTVRLNLLRPHVTVAEDLYNQCTLILDPHEDGVFAAGSNGTGPFDMTTLLVGERSVVRARAGSWRGTPHLDEVHFIDLGDDRGSWAAAMVSDQVDGLYELGFDQKILLDQVPGVKVYAAPSAQCGVARMQCDKKPFDDARVRRAMRMAVDPQRVLALAQGGAGMPGDHHHVCPIQPDYAPVPLVTWDPAAARRLLAEAGHEKGFETTLCCIDDAGPIMKSTTVMVEMWRDIGVTVNIQTYPQELYAEHWKEFPFAFTMWEHRPQGIMTLALGYRTGASWNESHYANPAFDLLVDQGMAEPDPVARRHITAQLEEIMHQDGPLVQATWVPHLTSFSIRVRNYRPHPMGYIAIEELSLDEPAGTTGG
ncbi:ABC transporter substrate-binding protein [Gluconacetobacter tumulisoli]|uniref:ABC transporter substrate-binding protein n=1 Tax=Gluconacetobacter tumulisoli TaxID=1286189 RepID=A0A7W4PLH2_9PROT|nr:ABC transporter substrate-binding protein [Gluconacetobacter tumulisoli]MBB2201833.1 ABC transporter substrate-binding protein [Gluconacetobacter tumulisoli]